LRKNTRDKINSRLTYLDCILKTCRIKKKITFK